MSLVYISLVLLQDCRTPLPLIKPPPTPAPTSKPLYAWTAWYSRDDNSDSSDASRRRRRRDLAWDSLSSSSEHEHEQCLAPDGDPLIFVDSLCHDGYYDDASLFSFSGGEYDPNTHKFLAPVCIYYDLQSLWPLFNAADVVVVDSIWLALCENVDTDFDSSLLGVDDLTNIVSARTFEDPATHNVQTAVGDRVDGVLGLNVTLIDATKTQFALCFDTVAVTADFNEYRNEIEISSNGVMNVRYTSSSSLLSCDVIGLPCLNFFFGCKDDLIGPEDGAVSLHSVSCDCNQGLTSIFVQYLGTLTNVRVVGFLGETGETILCSTSNVHPGDVVECNAADDNDGSAGAVFGRYTRFAVFHSAISDVQSTADAHCIGVIQSNCETQLVGTSVGQCDELLIYAWIDASVAYCDRIVLEWQAQQESGDNALIAHEVKSDTRDGGMLRTLNDMYPYLRWALICTLSMFAVLLLISAYICFVRVKIESMHDDARGQRIKVDQPDDDDEDDTDEDEDESHSSLDDVAKEIVRRRRHQSKDDTMSDAEPWSMAKLRRVIIRRRQRRLMTDEDIMSNTIHYNTPQIDPNKAIKDDVDDEDDEDDESDDDDDKNGGEHDDDEAGVSTVFTDEFMEDDNTTMVGDIATPIATEVTEPSFIAASQPQRLKMSMTACPSVNTSTGTNNETLYNQDVYFEDDNSSLLDRIPTPAMTEDHGSVQDNKLQLGAVDSVRTDENSKIPIYKTDAMQHGKIRANTNTTTSMATTSIVLAPKHDVNSSFSSNIDSNDLRNVRAKTSTDKVTAV